jgi:carboxyl-terminal processing protease
MKPFNRPAATFAAIGLALITASSAWCLRPAVKADAQSTEGRITEVTTQLLEQAQYAHQRLDDKLAAKFIDRYLDSLDGTHEIFLQSDTADFREVVPHLAEGLRSEGDTQPAHAIYDRFLKRLDQREKFVAKTLATDSFDFTGNDQFSTDREKAPRPRDLTEAQELWRQRLRAEYLQEKLAGKKPEEIVKTLTHRYESQAKMMHRLSTDGVLEMYLNALAHIYDPHSDYMGKETLESFNTEMQLSLAGIGATLQEEDGYCKIRDLVAGGPAARSGKVKVGDRIVGVSQNHGKDTTDVVDLPLPQAVELIRGAKGTDVTLTIIPALADPGVRKVVTIQRDEIHLEEQRAKARIVDFPAAGGKTVRLGIVDLPAFYASESGHGTSATADVTKLITKLKKENIRGLILDLRRNGGGSLEEAITLTGLFIPSGPVVQTRDLSGHVDVGDDRDGQTLYDGPLIVLTSRLTASASEILAGALQDYGRALIVGDSSTFGKGTVQTMLPLATIMKRNGVGVSSDPGALKITISKFYRPSGNSTQLKGVRPEIVLPSPTDIPEISESGMKNPLEWDTIPAAIYDHFDLVKSYAASLKQASEARVTADREFGWLREDLDRVKKDGASKTVSLNEAQRRTELDEAKARTKERNAERMAHPDPVYPTYEITVKSSSTAGLPAPLDPKKANATNPELKEDSDDAAATTPVDDIQLRETEHILTDYMKALDHSGPDAIVTKR